MDLSNEDELMETEESQPSGSLLFERFCQVLDHPTFRSMAPGKQLLYLQLLRWSYGEGKELVEASRLDMVRLDRRGRRNY